jgi:hypothetical protein
VSLDFSRPRRLCLLGGWQDGLAYPIIDAAVIYCSVLVGFEIVVGHQTTRGYNVSTMLHFYICRHTTLFRTSDVLIDREFHLSTSFSRK